MSWALNSDVGNYICKYSENNSIHRAPDMPKVTTNDGLGDDAPDYKTPFPNIS